MLVARALAARRYRLYLDAEAFSRAQPGAVGLQAILHRTLVHVYEPLPGRGPTCFPITPMVSGSARSTLGLGRAT